MRVNKHCPEWHPTEPDTPANRAVPISALVPELKTKIIAVECSYDKDRQWEKNQLVKRLNELGFKVEIKG